MIRWVCFAMGISLMAQDLILDAIPSPNRSPEAVQTWQVQLDLTVFAQPGDVFQVRLPTGEELTAQSLGSSERVGGISYAAKIQSAWGTTDLTLAANGDQVAGVMFLPSGPIVFEPSDQGTLLTEIDASAYPACGGAVEAPFRSPSSTKAHQLDNGSLIDVMVV